MSRMAYLLIDVADGQTDPVAAELDNRPGITTTDLVFGSHDIVACIEADDIEGLEKIVRDEITPMEQIVQTRAIRIIPEHDENSDSRIVK